LAKTGRVIGSSVRRLAPTAIKYAPKAIEGAGALYALKMQKDMAKMQQRTNELNAGAYGSAIAASNPGYGYPAGDPPRQVYMPTSAISENGSMRTPIGQQPPVVADFLSYKVGNTIPVWAIGAVVVAGLFILKNRR
jgi:hypothetical protein